MSPAGKLGYSAGMGHKLATCSLKRLIAVTPSQMTLHAEMLRLCARIGYSPPASR